MEKNEGDIPETIRLENFKLRIDPSNYSKDLGIRLYQAFFEAIDVLHKNGYYTSWLKLLLSAIDTMAFLTYSENNGKEFKMWLEKYVELGPIGITPDEIWEHRNSLLHMTTMRSRSVKTGKQKYLVPSVGEVNQEYKLRFLIPALEKKYGPNYRFYESEDFFMAVALGFDKFLLEVENDHDLKRTVMSNFGHIVPDKITITVHKNQ